MENHLNQGSIVTEDLWSVCRGGLLSPCDSDLSIRIAVRTAFVQEIEGQRVFAVRIGTPGAFGLHDQKKHSQS